MQVLVVGGGVIGLALANRLAAEAHDVLLLERETPGQRASWVAAGLLSPGSHADEQPAYHALNRAALTRWPAFVAELLRETGQDGEYEQSPVLFPRRAQRDPSTWDAFLAANRAGGTALDELDRPALDALQPGFGPRFDGAALAHDAARVRPPRLLAGLRRQAAARGVEIVSHCSVTALAHHGRRVTGAITARGAVIEADEVVLAAGAWSARLASTAGLELSVRPVRGQILLLRGPSGMLGPFVDDDDCYLLPRRDGRLLVGSTTEEAGFDAVTTPEALALLRRRAAELMPTTATLEVETAWAGLRPGTGDGLPYLGRALPGLVLATGHFRNGVLLAPITAELLADELAGRTPALDLAPFRHDR